MFFSTKCSFFFLFREFDLLNQLICLVAEWKLEFETVHKVDVFYRPVHFYFKNVCLKTGEKHASCI